jgi:hypothetical protein
MFNSIFGIAPVLKQISFKEKLERKKYIGMWSWKSGLMARMIIRFPMMVIRFMKRNMLKRRGCSSRFSVNPRRNNSETVFLVSSFHAVDESEVLSEKKIKYMNQQWNWHLRRC